MNQKLYLHLLSPTIPTVHTDPLAACNTLGTSPHHRNLRTTMFTRSAKWRVRKESPVSMRGSESERESLFHITGNPEVGQASGLGDSASQLASSWCKGQLAAAAPGMQPKEKDHLSSRHPLGERNLFLDQD